MLPFVRNTDEVTKCIELIKSEGLVRGPDFKIWLMAEERVKAVMEDLNIKDYDILEIFPQEESSPCQ
jgi:hypothetical protein